MEKTIFTVVLKKKKYYIFMTNKRYEIRVQYIPIVIIGFFYFFYFNIVCAERRCTYAISNRENQNF